MAELKVLEGGEEKGGHSDHLSKNRDSLGQEYGLSGSSVARLLRVNQLILEIKEMLDRGNMQLMAAVQLSYLPEQAQRMALQASEKFGIAINKDIASKIRKAPMTEKAIAEAIAGKQPEVDPVLGVIEEKPVPKPIKLSADIREKYFQDTDPKEVEAIIDKALAAWFKKKR